MLTNLYEHSPTDGDIILIGDDNVGVRFHSKRLKEVSGFFADAPESLDASEGVSIPGLKGYTLLQLRQAMHDEPLFPFQIPGTPWRSPLCADPLFDACVRYEMPLVAKAVLRAVVQQEAQEPPNHGLWLPLVYRACQFDCPDAAISTFHRASAHVNVLDDDEKPKSNANSMPGGSNWTALDAAKFKPEWVFAIERGRCSAMTTVVNGENLTDTDREYWDILASEFQTCLAVIDPCAPYPPRKK